jgi:hypothetical protein
VFTVDGLGAAWGKGKLYFFLEKNYPDNNVGETLKAIGRCVSQKS